MISGNSEGLAECGSRCGRARNGISEAPGLDEHPKGIATSILPKCDQRLNDIFTLQHYISFLLTLNFTEIRISHVYMKIESLLPCLGLVLNRNFLELISTLDFNQ